MKRIYIIGLFAFAISLSACKKDWYCLCSYEAPYLGKQSLGGEEYEKTSKDEAERKCKEKEESIKNAHLPGPQNTVCVIEQQ